MKLRSVSCRKLYTLHNKNNFIEISKNLNTDLKIILLNYQNNYVGILNMMSNAARNFDILVINLNVHIIILTI